MTESFLLHHNLVLIASQMDQDFVCGHLMVGREYKEGLVSVMQPVISPRGHHLEVAPSWFVVVSALRLELSLYL